MLKINKKERKSQIVYLQYKYILKLKYMIHMKLQLSHLKSKIANIECSFSLSLLYGFSLSRNLERETWNLSNFSNGIFKRNSEVLMSLILKIPISWDQTFSKFLDLKQIKFSTWENCSFQNIFQILSQKKTSNYDNFQLSNSFQHSYCLFNKFR